jgi:protein-S-isoprenylcysteine O-methyltransferase Ste14
MLSLVIEVLGTVLTILGLCFTVWARVHLGRYWSGIITLKQGHRLIRTGPYQLTRHPIYTGLLAAVLGTAIAASTGDAFVGFVVFTAAYVVKARREEALLTREFGDEYTRFKQEVPTLVPLVRWRAGKRRSDRPNQPR